MYLDSVVLCVRVFFFYRELKNAEGESQAAHGAACCAGLVLLHPIDKFRFSSRIDNRTFNVSTKTVHDPLH